MQHAAAAAHQQAALHQGVAVDGISPFTLGLYMGYIWIKKLVTHEDAHPNSFLDNKWNGVDGVPTSPQSQLSAAAAPYPLMLAAAHHADETH